MPRTNLVPRPVTKCAANVHARGKPTLGLVQPGSTLGGAPTSLPNKRNFGPAPAPSHTTGHTVFRIRRLDPAACHTAKRTGRRQAAAYSASCIAFCPEFRGFTLWLPLASARHGSTASAVTCSLSDSPYGGRTFRPGTPGNLMSRSARFSASSAPWSFGPSLQRRYPLSSLLWPLLTSPPFSRRRSPQVRRCFFPFIPSGSTSHVSHGFRASLWPASLPPVRGLSADSCSYGQRFVPRFLQLGLAASTLRFPSVTSIGPGEYVATHK